MIEKKRGADYINNDNIVPDFKELHPMGCYKLLQAVLLQCFSSIPKGAGDNINEHIRKASLIVQSRIGFGDSKTCRILCDVMEYDHSKIQENLIKLNKSIIRELIAKKDQLDKEEKERKIKERLELLQNAKKFLIQNDICSDKELITFGEDKIIDLHQKTLERIRSDKKLKKLNNKTKCVTKKTKHKKTESSTSCEMHKDNG